MALKTLVTLCDQDRCNEQRWAVERDGFENVGDAVRSRPLQYPKWQTQWLTRRGRKKKLFMMVATRCPHENHRVFLNYLCTSSIHWLATPSNPCLMPVPDNNNLHQYHMTLCYSINLIGPDFYDAHCTVPIYMIICMGSKNVGFDL